MRKKSLLIASLIFITFSVFGQGFSLNKAYYFHGEEMSFDLWLSESDSFDYVYLALIDPVSRSLVDHQAYLVDFRLVQGTLLPEMKDFPSGPYLLSAISNSGVVLGTIPLLISHFRDKDWLVTIMHLLKSAEPDKFLFEFETVLPKLVSFQSTRPMHMNKSLVQEKSWLGLHEFSMQNPNEFIQLNVLDDDGKKNLIILPTAGRIFTNQNPNQGGLKEEIWVTNDRDQSMEFVLDWDGQMLLSFDIEARDSVQLIRSEFPVGNLNISSKEMEERIANPPTISRISEDTLLFRKGELIDFALPKVINPYFHGDRYLIGGKLLLERPIISSAKRLDLLLDADEDSLPYLRAEAKASNGVLPKNFEGLVLMDSTGQYPLYGSELGYFEISSMMVYRLNRDQGRVRLAKMNEQLQIEVSYPELEIMVMRLLESGILETIEMCWVLPSFSDPNAQKDSFAFELIELDDVLIMSTSMEEVEAYFDKNPFSEHWINTDVTCGLGVLNCFELHHGHQILFGNHPKSVIKMPLHVILEMQKNIEDKVNNLADRDAFSIGEQRARRFNFSDQHVGPGARISRLNYKWEVTPYRQNMARLRFFNENHFDGQMDFDQKLYLGSQTKWSECPDDAVVKVEVPSTIGMFFIWVQYVDLVSGLRSDLIIPIKVIEGN